MRVDLSPLLLTLLYRGDLFMVTVEIAFKIWCVRKIAQGRAQERARAVPLVHIRSWNLPARTKALAMHDGSCFGVQDTEIHDHTSCRHEQLVRAQETGKSAQGRAQGVLNGHPSEQ